MLSTSEINRSVDYVEKLVREFDERDLFSVSVLTQTEVRAANAEARGRIIAAIVSRSKLDRHDSL